jgi:hypothetical protein
MADAPKSRSSRLRRILATLGALSLALFCLSMMLAFGPATLQRQFQVQIEIAGTVGFFGSLLFGCAYLLALRKA